MASYKGYGYNRYRGRTSVWKVVLSVVLVLVILASIVFLMLQKYIVYDESGTPHFVLPDEEQTMTETLPPEEELDITIEDAAPGETPLALVQAVQLGEDPAVWEGQLTSGQNAFCITMKASGGQLRYPFRTEAAGQVTADTAKAAAETLPQLLGGEQYAIARLSCLRDGSVARSNPDTLGLKNTGGYIFYDGNNENWLDPSKEGTKAYLAALAVECADLGFDEILLTDLTYPTVGKIDKIAYGFNENYSSQTAYNTEQISKLLAAIKTALGDRDVKLSLELSEAVVENGGVDELAGINLWDTLMARLYRIYVPTTEDRVDALVEQTLGNGVFMPELTAVPTLPSYKPYLLMNP